MKRLIATIALVAAVLAVLLPGAVTAAHASTISRANAVRSAKEYLHTMAFSRTGLIHQLRFDGYTAGDARYGVSHAHANWMRQAVRAAKDYLHTMPFSRSGMVQQLEFDGFTHGQALHGARAAGL